MAYKITGFDSRTGTINVLYENILPITLNLPIDPVTYAVPTGDALDKFINEAEPTFFTEQAKATAEQNKPMMLISNADEINKLIESPKVLDPILDATDLATGQTYAQGQLKTALISARGQYFKDEETNSPLTGYLRYGQAIAFKTAGYAGTVPPYIAQEILLSGETAQAATDTYLSTHQDWFGVIDPKLVAIVLQGIKDIQAAKDLPSVNTVYQSALASISKVVAGS